MQSVKSKLKIKNSALFCAVLIFTFFILHSNVASAARFFFETEVTEVGVGQEMEIVLYLDSEGETINALEGTIQVPGFLSVEILRDGNSLISFWAERPEARSDQDIVFSGIIPGGWRGSYGTIFSFIVETKFQGGGTIVLRDGRVLLHDGEGTEAVIKTEALTLYVDEAIPSAALVGEVEDSEPPEAFTPLLARDPDVFSGDYFLVFATQDKGSGIDRYEVQETRQKLLDEKQGEWQAAESPYRINDQELGSFIYVRAVDRAGNIRVAVFEPAKEPTKEPAKAPIRPADDGRVLIILIILLVIAAIFIYIRSKRQRT